MPMPQTAASPAPRERATAIDAVIRKFGPGETAATNQKDARAQQFNSGWLEPTQAMDRAS